MLDYAPIPLWVLNETNMLHLAPNLPFEYPKSIPPTIGGLISDRGGLITCLFNNRMGV